MSINPIHLGALPRRLIPSAILAAITIAAMLVAIGWFIGSIGGVR